MIKKTELRIGNWVKWDNADNYYRLEEVKENSGFEVNPIPLTPEILDKCGFENVYNNRWANDSVEIECNQINEGYYLLNGEETINWQARYRFLHQLQNLCYILTGEELQIKNLQPS